MDALEATGVYRKYGRQEVLKDFSLRIGEGRFEALMGPSGSGKSTFLHLAAGLIAADSGVIRIGGEAVTAMGDAAATRFRRRHVGVVFQSFNLLNDQTVRENILLPLRLESRRLANDRKTLDRLDTLLAGLRLTGLAGRKPEELSGGEQQRVAIARALIAEPEIVLADEPTGNLDVTAAREVCAMLKTLNRSEQSAVLVVTHDPQVAATAETVHFLRDGHIAASFPTNGDAAVVSERYLETYR